MENNTTLQTTHTLKSMWENYMDLSYKGSVKEGTEQYEHLKNCFYGAIGSFFVVMLSSEQDSDDFNIILDNMFEEVKNHWELEV